MQTLANALPRMDGKDRATPSDLPVPTSRPDWQPPSQAETAAAMAVDRLFDLLPPQDVGDAKAFLAFAIALFVRYPPQVQDQAVFEIPQRSDRPTPKLMRMVLDEINEPFEREAERRRAELSHRLSLPLPRAKRTPEEQARVDAHVAETRRALSIPQDGYRHGYKPAGLWQGGRR